MLRPKFKSAKSDEFLFLLIMGPVALTSENKSTLTSKKRFEVVLKRHTDSLMHRICATSAETIDLLFGAQIGHKQESRTKEQKTAGEKNLFKKSTANW